jgi:hypothetical protein
VESGFEAMHGKRWLLAIFAFKELDLKTKDGLSRFPLLSFKGHIVHNTVKNLQLLRNCFHEVPFPFIASAFC